jgi:hypothetical protein
LYKDQFSDRALHRQRSASGEATGRFRNRPQAIFQENSTIFRIIMHEPSGEIRAFDQDAVDSRTVDDDAEIDSADTEQVGRFPLNVEETVIENKSASGIMIATMPALAKSLRKINGNRLPTFDWAGDNH